ncbi:glycoside hydrolase family 26 protein [Paenibacillus sp. TRM 82003]|uniref:glycosyl hydrolase n=1 Tax=Kineococcus sp. TRM81007 TaxID=2925831 RepID=UPI001F5A2A46|nr:glycosyl hydrolase [Kineococcus sp. TRM81007]MCI2238922.1 glycoside hydrolase family 26 protein [Kineococcus sp. TRM81007]MCI3924329.1 glycoside hydrolase family 26 protein [Paenibacillus sp. TRM 82003]
MVDTTRQESRTGGGAVPPGGPRRRWVLGAGLAGAAVAGGVATWLVTGRDDEPPAAAPQRDWTPRTHVSAADLDTKWAGVYRTHDVAENTEFGEWLGRPLDVAVVFGAQNDWYALTHPWFAYEAPEGQDWAAWVRERPDERKLVVSTAMVPEGVPEDWRARGAAGEYDDHWVEYGRNLRDWGIGSSIIRLGWEMNGDWYETHYIGETAEQREQWKEYFRRIVRAVEVEGTSFEIDFTIAEGPQDSVAIDEMYPGDDYVDIIGMDVYDSWIAPIDPGARWQAKGEKINSVPKLVEFAAEHDKPLSFAEWAMVAEGRTQGGGDSPEFIHQMADVIAANPVRYQAYFDVPAGGVGMTLADAPLGAAAFLQRFGPGGDAAPTDR